MIIAIDANEANVDQHVGVSVYTLALLRYFYTKSTPDCQFVLYLKHPPKAHMPQENAHFTYRVIGPSRMWLRISLPAHFLIQRPHFDVFFSPAHYSPAFCPAPLVTAIHDLAYEYFPSEFLAKDLYTLRHWTRTSVAQSARLIAVSQNTKQDMVRLYDVHPDRIEVIYNGFSVGKSDTQWPSSIPHSIRYIAYVGTLQPRKNVARLIEAFTILRKTQPDLHLVLVGKKGWMYESIEQALLKSDSSEFIHLTGFVSDEQKSQILRNALCFVMPSLYEGFNIPLLEAQSVGCPVACSNTSCLPEVGGSSCVYFDPTDTKDMAQTIETVLTSPTIRRKLEAEMVQNTQRFSWDEAGSKTLALLQSVAKTRT